MSVLLSESGSVTVQILNAPAINLPWMISVRDSWNVYKIVLSHLCLRTASLALLFQAGTAVVLEL